MMLNNLSLRTKSGFGISSNTVLRNPEISLGEKALYCYLCTYANDDDTTFVSVHRMASELGIGYSTALRYLSLLESKKIISRAKRKYKQSSLITLLK